MKKQDVLDFLKNRRSTKQYTDEPVLDEELDAILEAGLYAPSGRNLQSTVLLCVKEKKLRDELAADNAAVMHGDHDPFYNAPVVIAVLGDKSVSTHVYDGSLALGNMLLAAEAVGLGACWIHRAREMFEMPKYQELLRAHGISGDYEGIGFCIVGHPAKEKSAPLSRKENRVFFI